VDCDAFGLTANVSGIKVPGDPLTVLLLKCQDDRTNTEEQTNVGSTKTIGEGTECPGIGSNHTPTIRSLHNPVQNSIHTNESKHLLKRVLTDLAESNPCEPDQTKEEQDPHAKGYVSVYVGPLHYLCS
jgi:hypothetical protein